MKYLAINIVFYMSNIFDLYNFYKELELKNS